MWLGFSHHHSFPRAHILWKAKITKIIFCKIRVSGHNGKFNTFHSGGGKKKKKRSKNQPWSKPEKKRKLNYCSTVESPLAQVGRWNPLHFSSCSSATALLLCWVWSMRLFLSLRGKNKFWGVFTQPVLLTSHWLFSSSANTNLPRVEMKNRILLYQAKGVAADCGLVLQSQAARNPVKWRTE